MAVSTTQACGPSMQSIYEGDVRFEHCYRLDLDSEIVRSHRLACWRDWSRVYTYGQRRDKIEYARRRIRSLTQGDPHRPELNVDVARRPQERQFYLSVPSPTSVRAPPPPIATRTYEPSEYTPPESVLPDGPCTRACQTEWEACRKPCSSTNTSGARGVDAAAPDAGLAESSKLGSDQKDGPCSACSRDYRGCMQRCFE